MSALSRRLALFLALVAAPCIAAPAKGAALRIKTRSGTTVIGELAGETAQGLLLSNGSKTQLVPFGEIAQMDELSAVAPAPPRPPPVAAAIEAPPPEPPPPPLEVPEEPPAPPPPPRGTRLGVAFNLGATGDVSGHSPGPNDSALAFGVDGVLSTQFGWFDLRPTVGFFSSVSGAPVVFGVRAGADGMAILGRWVAVGVGFHLMASFWEKGFDSLIVAPAVYPFVLRLGENGKAELGLTLQGLFGTSRRWFLVPPEWQSSSTKWRGDRAAFEGCRAGCVGNFLTTAVFGLRFAYHFK